MSDDHELDTNELAKQLSYLAADAPPPVEYGESSMSRRELLKRGGVGVGSLVRTTTPLR